MSGATTHETPLSPDELRALANEVAHFGLSGMSGRLLALAKELPQLRADAERLDWLQATALGDDAAGVVTVLDSRPDFAPREWPRVGLRAGDPTADDWQQWVRDDLRTAIDAARTSLDTDGAR